MFKADVLSNATNRFKTFNLKNFRYSASLVFNPNPNLEGRLTQCDSLTHTVERIISHLQTSFATSTFIPVSLDPNMVKPRIHLKEIVV